MMWLEGASRRPLLSEYRQHREAGYLKNLSGRLLLTYFPPFCGMTCQFYDLTTFTTTSANLAFWRLRHFFICKGTASKRRSRPFR